MCPIISLIYYSMEDYSNGSGSPCAVYASQGYPSGLDFLLSQIVLVYSKYKLDDYLIIWGILRFWVLNSVFIPIILIFRTDKYSQILADYGSKIFTLLKHFTIMAETL